MNRYIREGILNDLRAGKKIFYVGISHSFARDVFDKVVEDIDDDMRYRKSAGDLAILAPQGGVARFISRQSNAHRGRKADVVILDGTIGYEEYMPMVVTTGGELIRL